MEQVLPTLLEKSVERGWRALVRVGNPERVEPLSQTLWTYRDESFLAHGTASDGALEDQPIALTDAEGNPNGADILFVVDGAEPGDVTPYQRCVLMFDGHDEQAVEAARGHWKTLSGGDHDTTYWQQNDAGGWEKKA